MAHMLDATKRDYFNRRLSEFKLERSSFDSHYRELAQYTQPRRGRFFAQGQPYVGQTGYTYGSQGVNSGSKRHKFIINSKATQAQQTAQNGLLAGVMSPTRPWFDLTLPDPDLANFRTVKIWLETVAKQMRAVFNAGNLYNMAPTMLGEMLLFGQGAMSHLDDDDHLARFYAHTVGSYYMAQDEKFRPNTFAREMMMTVVQMANEFTDGKDLSKLSKTVQTSLEQNRLEQMFPVVQFIEPNDEFRWNNPLSKYKAWKSTKYEPENVDKEQMLMEMGFDDFPVYLPRWEVTGEDIYGTNCPGMATLGDTKQLQIMEKRKAQAIDKMVNPALTGPASVKNVPVNALPGGLTVYDGDPSRNKLERLYEVNINLSDLKADIEKVERRIDEAYYVDMFLAITNMEGIQPRNELELNERNSERLLQLGPVLERVQGEFLDPLISRAFDQMVKAGLVPPPPPEIEGEPLKVDYVSSLAQAQRAVGTKSIDRLARFTAGLMESGLSDGKKFNGDEAIDNYAQLVGTPATLIADSAEVEAARAQDAQQAQMQQMAELAPGLISSGASAVGAAGQAAGAVGGIDMGGDNPVANITKQLSNG
jgi:hypothetical protein